MSYMENVIFMIDLQLPVHLENALNFCDLGSESVMVSTV